ncbi:Hypothetical predicted protein [Octopus vulgaris]|uniref:Uncharacterized protein n=1 Tax=Octopus vulgaris TaxID=6645 RepID=A0AA36FE95_OCTVU|nr:Hypothetical predicted protein [Octopus vulgaris]
MEEIGFFEQKHFIGGIQKEAQYDNKTCPSTRLALVLVDENNSRLRSFRDTLVGQLYLSRRQKQYYVAQMSDSFTLSRIWCRSITEANRSQRQSVNTNYSAHNPEH